MATRNTDIANGQASRNVRDRVNSKLSLGQPGVVLATYTTTGAEAAGDLVKIATLPAGARPLVDRWRVSAEAVGGTTATVATLGIETDDDAFSATAVGITSAVNSAVTPIAGYGAEFTALAANTVVYAKLGLSSGSYTAGKKVGFRLEYLLP